MTQKQYIKKALLSGRSITPIEALQECGSFRLGGIIHRLRQEGMDIITSLTKKGYARYYLGEPARRIF